MIYYKFSFYFFRTFEGIVNYCSFHGNVIPLSFVLGFYVTVVMNRWWNQYTTIPWPDSIAVFVSATIHGQVRNVLKFIIYYIQNFKHCFNNKYLKNICYGFFIILREVLVIVFYIVYFNIPISLKLQNHIYIICILNRNLYKISIDLTP